MEQFLKNHSLLKCNQDKTDRLNSPVPLKNWNLNKKEFSKVRWCQMENSSKHLRSIITKSIESLLEKRRGNTSQLTFEAGIILIPKPDKSSIKKEEETADQYL